MLPAERCSCLLIIYHLHEEGCLWCQPQLFQCAALLHVREDLAREGGCQVELHSINLLQRSHPVPSFLNSRGSILNCVLSLSLFEKTSGRSAHQLEAYADHLHASYTCPSKVFK